MFIYTLTDPRDDSIRYVGKTNNPKIRLKSHTYLRGTTPCSKWINNELRPLGLKPKMFIVLEVEQEIWEYNERLLIGYYRANGCKLLNVADGGGETGWSGQRTQATKDKLKLAFTGRTIPEEQRKRISQSLMGKKQSQETILKRRETINANRLLKGHPPLPSYANREQKIKARIARMVAHKYQKRREDGCPIRGSLEWRHSISEGLLKYHSARRIP